MSKKKYRLEFREKIKSVKLCVGNKILIKRAEKQNKTYLLNYFFIIL